MNIQQDFDKFDESILRILQHQGRIANQELAAQVGLSPAACLRRVRSLEVRGVITGYHAQINPKALGYDITVLVEIGLSSESAVALEQFERAIGAQAEVLECLLMSGETDYLLKVAVRDLADYERMHRQVLANLPHVAKIKTSFAIRRVVQDHQPSLRRR